MSAPQRAFRLTLKLDADTRDDLISALDQLQRAIAREEVTRGTWGSPSHGAIYELLSNPEQTHESYFAQLHEYLAELDAKNEPKMTTLTRERNAVIPADRGEVGA